MHRKAALIIVLMLFASGCVYAQSTSQYANSYFGFEFDYPISWNELVYPGEVILVKEKAGKELDNLATFDVTADSTTKDLHKYCDSYETMIRTSGVFTNFAILSKRDIRFAGTDAVEYHCTATASDMPMEWKSVVLSHRGKMLKLSTASIVGFYDKKLPTTDSIFQSFRLK